MLRIILTAAFIAVALVVIKQDRVLQRAGLVGYCNTVAAPTGQDGDWRACRPGKLAGRPDLSLDSCTQQGVVGRIEYWRCPAAVGSGVTVASG
jgi:hypothetical protein